MQQHFNLLLKDNNAAHSDFSTQFHARPKGKSTNLNVFSSKYIWYRLNDFCSNAYSPKIPNKEKMH